MTLINSTFKSPQSIPPIWLMRQAGRYLPEYLELRTKAKTFVDFCLSPTLATEASLQPIKRFDFDAAILFSDILMIPFGLGQNVTFEQNEGPKLGDLKGLSLNNLEEKLKPIFETVMQVRSKLHPSKSLIGFAGGVWTVLCYMIASHTKDWYSVVQWGHERQKDFEDLLALVVEATIFYLEKQIEHGADIIQIFDSWSSIVPQQYQSDWVINPTIKIVSTLKSKHPHVKVIGFPKGFKDLNNYSLLTGIDGLSVDQNQTLDFETNILLQGNLSPETLLEGGDRLIFETEKILDTMKDRKFIFNLGHGILPQTPIRNVEKLIKIIRG